MKKLNMTMDLVFELGRSRGVSWFEVANDRVAGTMGFHECVLHFPEVWFSFCHSRIEIEHQVFHKSKAGKEMDFGDRW